MHSLLRSVLDLVAPLRCPLCGLTLAPAGACPHCGLPDQELVGRVLQRDTFGEYLGLAGGSFRDPLRRLIHGLKYRQDPGALALLVRQTALALPPGLVWEALVAVPAHPVRVRERGWGVTDVLTRGLAHRLTLPVRTPLKRTRYTEPLAGLGAAARRQLLVGALHSSPVTGCLLLVDDVFTTGATFRACRRALLEAGADAVDLLVAARTPRGLRWVDGNTGRSTFGWLSGARTTLEQPPRRPRRRSWGLRPLRSKPPREKNHG